ncbi:MAG: YitT family protein [Bacilli bacterium]|nr:YitT family protein [Bacilli bacterium]
MIIKRDKHKPMSRTEDLIYSLIMIFIGSIFMAFAFVFFIEYNGLVVGGVGGVAIVINSLFGEGTVDTSTFITVVMWSLFVVGFIVVGKEFALKTLPATIFYPVFIALFEYIINNPNIMLQGKQIMETFRTINPILSVVFGGVIYGTGAGMMFKVGGSSGGLDITATIFSRLTHVKIDVVLFMQDAIVIGLGVFNLGLEPVLLGIALTYVMSKMVDKQIVGNEENMMVFIISKKYEEINQFILHNIERGTTIIPCKGGYTNSDKNEIQVVINKHDFFKLQKFIKETDPNCFMSVLRARDVFGEGFKRVKGDK